MGDIDLNMDLTKSVIVDSTRLEWVRSPSPGVERKRLEREETESGRATTIVRYQPGVSFPSHVHPGGEEYLVLEGTFSDRDGDFREGTYVRNPPGSSHAPFSNEGCTIFVKLCQMEPGGEAPLRVNAYELPWERARTVGHSMIPLYRSEAECVTLERLEPRTALGQRVDHGGEELLVLDGRLDIAGTGYGRYTWIRLAPGAVSDLSSAQGCTLWVKRGHLTGC